MEESLGIAYYKGIPPLREYTPVGMTLFCNGNFVFSDLFGIWILIFVIFSSMALIVGHRGSAGHAPENTLLSFRTAIDLGCPVVECDVHLSRDGKIVVIHDKTVDRTTNGSGEVSDMTLEEIKQLRIDCHFDRTAGVVEKSLPTNIKKGSLHSGRDDRYQQTYERVPTLQEVIDLVLGKAALQIELKGVGTPAAVLKLLTETSFAPHIIMSFKRELLTETRQLDRQAKLGLLFMQMTPDDLWDFAIDTELTSVCPHHSLVTPEMVAAAHAQALTVYAFHVNTKADGDRLLGMDVDEIGTDYPELFLS